MLRRRAFPAPVAAGRWRRRARTRRSRTSGARWTRVRPATIVARCSRRSAWPRSTPGCRRRAGGCSRRRRRAACGRWTSSAGSRPSASSPATAMRCSTRSSTSRTSTRGRSRCGRGRTRSGSPTGPGRRSSGGDPAAPRLALAALADGRLLAEADARRAYELCARVLVVTGHAAAERDDRRPARSRDDGADARRGDEPRGRPRPAPRSPLRSRGARPHRAGLPGPVPRRRTRAARARARRARRPRGGAGGPPRRGPRSRGRQRRAGGRPDESRARASRRRATRG